MTEISWEAKARFVEKYTGREGRWMPLADALAIFQRYDREQRERIAYLECTSLLPLTNGRTRKSIAPLEIEFLISEYLNPR